MTTNIAHGAYRRRFLFDTLPARGVHVRLQDVWRHIVGQKDYPPAVARALGELSAAAALLSENLKSEGTLIVQIQGTGCLKMLVAEAASGQTVRATARWDEQADIADHAGLNEMLGTGGIFAITFQPPYGESRQGIVPLEGGSIAEMLTAYMARSEQIETVIFLTADNRQASGLLLQRLPENQPDHESWLQAAAPAQTLTAKELSELDTEPLLYRLFHENPPRVFPAEVLEFACTCSRGKVADMLLLLGAEEVRQTLAQEGSVSAACDFCHTRYTFDETDIDALFAGSMPPPSLH